jgi:hypothetical protein
LPRNCSHGPALVLAVVRGAGFLAVVALVPVPAGRVLTPAVLPVVTGRRPVVVAPPAGCVVAGEVTAVVGAAGPDVDVWPPGEVVRLPGEVPATELVCVVTAAWPVDEA